MNDVDSKFYIDLMYNLIGFFTYMKFCNYHFPNRKKNYVYNNFYMIIIQTIFSLFTIKYYVIISFFSYMIYNILSFKTKVAKSFLYLIRFEFTYYTAFAATFFIVTYLYEFLTKSVSSLHNTLFQNLKGIVIIIIIYIIFSLLYNNKKSQGYIVYNPYRKFIYFLLVLIILILCTFMLISIKSVPTKENLENIILITFIINIIMIIVIISIYEKIVDFLQESTLQHLKVQKYEMNQTFYDELSIKVKQLSLLRHDFRNHLGIIRGNIEKEYYKEALEYLDSLTTYANSANEIILTNHQMVSSILQVKKAECDKLGILLELDISFDSIVKITDMDIVILLSNILDNAIQATSHTQLKQISFVMRQVRSFLSITCTNTYNIKPIERNGLLISSKKDKELHGIGLVNVKETCEKYQGEYHYSFDDNTFHTKLLIPNY